MAGESSYSARDATDDTLCPAERHQHFSGYLNGASSSSSASSSPFFETICGSLYRKKLEKGQVQYREVLAEDKRLQLIKAFHVRTPETPHHTLEDTYRLVAEHYWWEGIFFQVRDFVLNCEECSLQCTEKAQDTVEGNVSKMVKSHSHDVLNKLNSQRETGLFCDITLKTGNGHSFVAHKAVLSAVSEYFQELFTEMDSAVEPQPHVDLTGFNEESLLALLEFSYTSTLTLNLSTLTEVATMARHLRMWPALEACSALRSEQVAVQKPLGVSSGTPGSSSMNSWRDKHSPSAQTVGFKRRREKEKVEALGSSRNSSIHSRVHIVEGTDESDTEWSAQALSSQCQNQALSTLHAEDNGFPCSPTRRMKLMDFKSPSSKRKLSPRPSPSVISSPSTSTRSSSPSRRLLRSTPGAALALRRLLPKIDLSSKRKRKPSSCHRPCRVKADFSVLQSRSLSSPIMPVKVKQEREEEEISSVVPQDEVLSPRAQEKYRLLNFLGLQRKSLVPDPEERAGWGQKKRLRKLKVSDYCLTARRKPCTKRQGGYAGDLGCFVGVNSSLSLCDMTRMDLLKKVVKVEPQVDMDRRSKRKRETVGQTECLGVRATRSQSLQVDSRGIHNDRPLRSHSRQPSQLPAQPASKNRSAMQGTSPKKATLRTKQEPREYAISQPALSGSSCCQASTVATRRAKLPAPKCGPPVDRSLRATTTGSKRTLRYNVGRVTTEKHKGTRKNMSAQGKPSCNQVTVRPEPNGMDSRNQVKKSKKNMAQGRRAEEKVVDLLDSSWNISRTNHQHYHDNPLYRTIKEEPADPLPLTQTFLTSDASDLGKRQSKPPVKLLDQGFLFGLCRPPGGIKRDEESVDIYLTRSVSHSSASHSNTSPGIVRRDRIKARLSSDGSGLNGPHWAGLGNRSTSSSQRMLVRVKKEEESAPLSQHSKAIKSSTRRPVTQLICQVKKEPQKAKNVNKLYPVSSRRTVMLESIRRARHKQPKGLHGQSSGGVHACLQCRASYRDCDALIMHCIRHIEGKHWPCPLCSKTFFRQKNVRNHIRTHNPKLYKCRQCLAAC